MKIGRSGIITIGTIIVVLCVVAYVMFSVSIGDRFKSGSDLAQIQNDNDENALPYTDLEGNPFDLDTLSGKPLIVNGWASWCPFCVDELPAFGELKAAYGEEITVVAINRKESAATARAFIEHVGNPEGIIFLLDASDKFYKTIQGYAMPETVFYDKSGTIAARKRGTMGIAEMRELTEVMLSSTTK